ncbi:MAG TPA: histidine phosphatase family protein [Xanthobacteraceae bacterium]|nr:histidine phosphatase family protein [Xanthobacteraceae bacterium]
MSNSKPHPVSGIPPQPEGVEITRWWWVRHAPVRVDNGHIYGQQDLPCDCTDTVVFDAVAKILPRTAVWYSSHLQRTHQTAAAIFAAGMHEVALRQEPAFAEQHLGEWQGRNRLEFFASRAPEIGSYWFAPADERAPGGESFNDLAERVCAAIDRINAMHRGEDIVVVAHGGPIKAAIAHALGLPPKAGFAFAIDNCSVTRLDHLANESHIGWRVPMINQQPWIADRSHAAMHQPAGPEIATSNKLG